MSNWFELNSSGFFLGGMISPSTSWNRFTLNSEKLPFVVYTLHFWFVSFSDDH